MIIRNVTLKISNWLANSKKLPEEVKGQILGQTEKAYKFQYYAPVTIWLPKSQVKIIEEKQEEI